MIAPAVVEIEAITTQIEHCDAQLSAIAKASPVAKNLRTMRGVGVLTSLAFIAAVDDPRRFQDARQLSSYLGLVPSENNSGDSTRRPGAITKTGDPLLRAYLVEAAYAMTNKRAPVSNLRNFFIRATSQKGSKLKAAVAVARRMARVLWAMWRDETPFNDSRTAPLSPERSAA